MQEQDKDRFSAMMKAAGEIYTKEITKPLMRMYFAALGQVTIDQAESAMMAHMQDPNCGQYFPKPADLIRQITGTDRQNERALEDRAALAWACIEGEIRRIGSYGTLNLEDRQAMAAVKATGGWSQLCASTTEQLTWKRKEFINAYATFERTPVDMLPNKLPGRIEISESKESERSALKSLADGVARFRLGNQAKIENNQGEEK